MILMNGFHDRSRVDYGDAPSPSVINKPVVPHEAAYGERWHLTPEIAWKYEVVYPPMGVKNALALYKLAKGCIPIINGKIDGLAYP